MEKDLSSKIMEVVASCERGNEPDTLFISPYLYGELLKDSGFRRALTQSSEVNMIYGMDVRIVSDLKGLCVMNTRHEAWPKPSDYSNRNL